MSSTVKKVECPVCGEALGDYSDYEGVSGKTARWWVDKALYEHLDELHS